MIRKSRSRKSLAVPVLAEAAEEVVQVEEDPTEPVRPPICCTRDSADC